jgi:hypothetical protein
LKFDSSSIEVKNAEKDVRKGLKEVEKVKKISDLSPKDCIKVSYE